MAGTPSFQFYPGDWLKDPRLGQAAPATRGIFIDLVCAAWNADDGGRITGTVRGLSRLCRCDSTEMADALDEIESLGIADVDRGEVVTVTSRRVARDIEGREAHRARQRRYRQRQASEPDEADAAPEGDQKTPGEPFTVREAEVYFESKDAPDAAAMAREMYDYWEARDFTGADRKGRPVPITPDTWKRRAATWLSKARNNGYPQHNPRRNAPTAGRPAANGRSLRRGATKSERAGMSHREWCESQGIDPDRLGPAESSDTPPRLTG